MTKFETVVTNHLLDNPAKTVKKKFLFVCLLFVIHFVWTMLATKFLLYLWPEIFVWYPDPNAIPQPEPTFRYEFFMAVIFAPLWEEIAYRYAPYKLAERFGRACLLPVIAISTFIFGWGHGNGPVSIIYQGMSGLLFTYVYLKNGYSYRSSVALHFMWNFTCVMLGM